MTQHIEKILVWITWALIGVFLGLVGLSIYFQNFYQKNPIVYTNLPTPVKEKIVKAGDPVYGITSRCAKDDYLVTTTRQLVNDLVYGLTSTTVEVQKGCNTVNRIIFTVPAELPTGKYHVDTVVSIPVKWLWFHRTDTVHIYSETFNIIHPAIDDEAASTSK